MRKVILLLFFTTFLNAQGKIEEYTASNGITYKTGDTITLGLGSGGQGTFVYLKMSGWMAGTDTQIGSAYAGLNVVVKKIKVQKFKGAEKVYFTVGGGNITNYSLEIEEAIAVCEVKDCKRNNDPVQNSGSKYDELKKIKALFDEGVLSKEEYETEKKKILG
ncbi:SHOCT domain-containing protein [Flavobacterium oncorhynchi]|uniref:SHOCT domain-containing protein n=1 Tax=Flavobacterium oncorhynchi TaxID=728056 RepID=UPI00351AA0AF